MKTKVLTFFKRAIGVQCPYCGGFISYTLLDGLGDLIKFVFFKGQRSKYLKVSCLKCHKLFLVNRNRPLELLFIFMLFMGISFNIFGWPILLVNYKFLYVFLLIFLLIYLEFSRVIIKSEKD